MNKVGHLNGYTLDPMVIRLLEEDFCKSNHVVVLGNPPQSPQAEVTVGMLDTSDKNLTKVVERMLGHPIKPVQLNAHEVDRVAEWAFNPDQAELDLSGPGAFAEQPHLRLSADRQIDFNRGRDVPAILLDILSQAVARRATDVHIETYDQRVDVRLRIDGVLHLLPSPVSKANIAPLLSHLKVLTNLDIAEHFHPQDGHLVTTFTDSAGVARRVDFRVCFLPGMNHEDVVLRVLDESYIKYELTELGMPRPVYEHFHDMLHNPGGMILVTGPTASGKTTTLYAALRHINHENLKIVTVEDPIEYDLNNVNQNEVNAHMTFPDYSRAIIRQNPDVIMIGEIRDDETAAIALRAAQIGHLVLATLHTRDARGAVGRLVTLGVEPSQLAYTILGAVSQRLVRKVCPDCRHPYAPDPAMIKMFPSLPSDLNFTHGVGCEACGGTGFKGMTGVFELLDFGDETLRRMIATKTDIAMGAMPDLGDNPHMLDDAIDKICQGITTVEEVARTVPVPGR